MHSQLLCLHLLAKSQALVKQLCLLSALSLVAKYGDTHRTILDGLTFRSCFVLNCTECPSYVSNLLFSLPIIKISLPILTQLMTLLLISLRKLKQPVGDIHCLSPSHLPTYLPAFILLCSALLPFTQI